MIDFKDIMNEWQTQFPILSPYTPRTLFTKADKGLQISLEYDLHD